MCSIVDYVVCSPEAHAALWQVLLALELCSKIEIHRVPLDDPLRHLLTDPRQVTTTALERRMWARPLDVGALLAARSTRSRSTSCCRCAIRCSATTYRLAGGPDGATCAATTRPPRSSYRGRGGRSVLGGTRLAELAGAGQVHGSAAAIARLDRALLAEREPQFGTYF